MKQYIPFAKPVIGEEEGPAVARVLATGWVTQGPEVERFEQDFAQCVEAPYACAVANCTAALHLALLALDVGAGDEVITVSHSFIATANVVQYCGATPVFVDVDPVNGNILPEQISSAVSSKTKALLVVHQLGMPCDMSAILEIADRHGLPVIEDAACAIGSEILIDGSFQRIGRPHGRIACFSFHPRKIITTGDGGMLTTADPELDRRFRLLRQHGMNLSDRARHAATTIQDESYVLVGYNYRMTDIQAAVGRIQLSRLDEIVTERRRQAARYAELLTGIEDVAAPSEPVWARSNWQSYCVRLSPTIDTTAVRQKMQDQGIATRRGVMCAHLEPAYQQAAWRCTGGRDMVSAKLANSEALRRHGIMLPLFPGLTSAEQDRVVQSLRASLDELNNGAMRL